MNEYRIDKNLYWTGLVFFVGLVLLGSSWWKALIVALAMAAAWYLTYSRRLVGLVGMIVLTAGFAQWLGLLPAGWNEAIALLHAP